MSKFILGGVAAVVLAVAVAGGVTATKVEAGSASPGSRIEVVGGGQTDVFNITFYGGERAEVAIHGDGDTDLDLYVYDSRGNLVASADGYSDVESVAFRPRYTERYTVRVVNRSRSVANRYAIAWN